MFSFSDLENDLKNLGIAHSDTLLVHSSMKSIGEVAGGADGVLAVLMEYFKDAGLLVFPTLSYRFINAENTRFDVKNTPACTGILPELFRSKAGVIRSLHPTHSVAAYGCGAAEFTAGHEKCDTPAPAGSPWWKLLQRKGKIMFIGTGISCNTFLHGCDEWLKLPGLLTTGTENLEIVDYHGNIIPCPQHRHCGGGRNAYYGSLESEFDQAHALKRGKFGNANCHILDCEKICRVLGYSI